MTSLSSGRLTAGRLVVVDASLVAMWVLEETHSRRADALVAEWIRGGVQILAPSFLLAEVSNAIYKRVRRSELTFDQALEALEIVLGFGIQFVTEPAAHRRAMALAQQFDRPTTYDAQYLALAELHGCPIWTGDERLYNAVGTRFRHLRWIGASAPVDNTPD